MGFGSEVPFAEPAWYREGLESPYYNDSHRELRKRVRDFVDKEIAPHVDEWDEAGVIPNEIYEKAYDAGIYATPWSEGDIGFKQTGNIHGFDAFHDLIWLDELGRCGSGGLTSGFTIYTMALPPILMFGSEEMKKRILPGVISARKRMALAISEPTGGSDVASMKTTAVREGDHFVVSGTKKWITCAAYADYFTVACRTDKGISLLLVEKDMPGLTVRPLKLMGNWSAGTSLVTFDDVMVPVANLIGKEGEGFKAIMMNFNHERFVIAVQGLRMCRDLIRSAIEYARERKTFGKRLMDNQSIRFKIMEMVMRVEPLQAWLENIAYNIQQGAPPAQVASMMALAKVAVSNAGEYCARETSQIYGGAGIVRGGKGQKIERAWREVRPMSIYGGASEIMMDLAARQSKL